MLIEMLGDFIRQKKSLRSISVKHGISPKSPGRLPHSFVVVNDFLVFKSLLFDSLLHECLADDKRCRDRIEFELHNLVLSEEHFSQYLAFYIDYQLKRHHNEDVNRAADLLPYMGNKESFEQ